MQKSTTLLFVLGFIFNMQIYAQQRVDLSTNMATQEYSLDNFNALNVDSDYEVIMKKGNENKVVITANENLLPYLKVDTKKESLKLHMEDNIYFKGNMRLRAVVYSTNNISNYAIEDDATVAVEYIIEGNLNLAMSDDAGFKSEVDCKHINIAGKSDSDIKLKGQCKQLNAALKSDSKLEGKDFVVGNASIALKGDSTARMAIDNSLSIAASGDSIMEYSGNPKITSAITGDAELRKID